MQEDASEDGRSRLAPRRLTHRDLVLDGELFVQAGDQATRLAISRGPFSPAGTATPEPEFELLFILLFTRSDNVRDDLLVLPALHQAVVRRGR